MKHANVALFVPHNGCPHQCSFCNQRQITGRQEQPSPKDVEQAVRTALASGCDPSHAEIAFFGGSFTAVEPAYMESLLKAAKPYVGVGGFSGIRISTRPDAVEEPVLQLLRSYGVTSIELGAQSMDDRVLALNRRGHTAQQVREASRRIRDMGFSLGLQMMTGLAGDTSEGALHTAQNLAELKPDTMRIYPAIVMKNTELGQWYLNGKYTPQTLEEAVALCAELLVFFEEQKIRVIRLGLHSMAKLEEGMLAGPWHPAFRELCESRILRGKMQALLEQHPAAKEVVFCVHPRMISKALGQKKENVRYFELQGTHIRILQDASLDEEELRIL